MSTDGSVAAHVRTMLARQKALLDELVGLAPKGCADPDTTDASSMTWQSSLLAIDNAFWALDDLADDMEFLEGESRRNKTPDKKGTQQCPADHERCSSESMN